MTRDDAVLIRDIVNSLTTRQAERIFISLNKTFPQHRDVWESSPYWTNPPEYQGVCPAKGCGKSFIKKSATAIYCSYECQNRSARRRHYLNQKLAKMFSSSQSK